MSVLQLLSSIRSEVEAANESVLALQRTSSAVLGQASAQASQAVREIRQAKETSDDLIKALTETTLVDDLLEQLGILNTGVDQQLQSVFEAVKSGDVKVRDALREFGNIKIGIAADAQTIQEIIGRIDLRLFTERAQQIRTAVRENVLDLQDIQTLLGSIQNDLAARLLEVINLFDEGKVTLERVLEVAESARRSLDSDSVTGALAEGLETLLRRGRKGGQL